LETLGGKRENERKVKGKLTLNPAAQPMPKRPSSAKREPKLLGKTAIFPSAPAVSTLDTFRNAHPQRDYWIRFESHDFTSLCPVTGQPDFARITIDYVPGELCIETKSLKYYLASFRNTRSFNEQVVNRILDDLVAACAPREMTVNGEFAARGGIALSVRAAHPATALRPPAAPKAQQNSR
jgi:7-cyano-7-deazaguanine reductase